MCFENDELWSMDDNSFIEFAINEMKKLKLIKNEDIISTNIIKIKKLIRLTREFIMNFLKLENSRIK